MVFMQYSAALALAAMLAVLNTTFSAAAATETNKLHPSDDGNANTDTVVQPRPHRLGEDPFDLHKLKTPGAVCLDGTQGAFYFHRGSGSGSDKWILFLEGGGWCMSPQNCVDRSKTDLGSSKNYPPTFAPNYEGGNGLLGTDANVNPDFYNWNLVYARYCDGASFAGNVQDGVIVNGTKLHFRGFHILNALLAELGDMGLYNATQAMLAGCSAGGLATYIHCDYFAEHLPKADVKCVADAGYFPDFVSTDGVAEVRQEYHTVFDMQNVSAGVNQRCLHAMTGDDSYKCFFPQYSVPYQKTPIFAINSGYDSWQTKADWFKNDPNYAQCAQDITKCNSSQVVVLQHYHSMYVDVLEPILSDDSPHGAWIDSCHLHCQSSNWMEAPFIRNISRQSIVSDWYFGRAKGAEAKIVDCPWPCHDPGSRCS